MTQASTPIVSAVRSSVIEPDVGDFLLRILCGGRFTRCAQFPQRFARSEDRPDVTPIGKPANSGILSRLLMGGPTVAAKSRRASPRRDNLIVSEWRGLRPPSESGARVVDDRLFRFLVDLEVQKAQRLRYCFSIICLAFDVAPLETRELAFADIATRYIRATDLVAPLAPASLALLLVDAETAHLPPILRRLTTLLEPIAWSAGASCYPKTATHTDDMLRQAIDSMIRAREHGGHRLYVGP